MKPRQDSNASNINSARQDSTQLIPYSATGFKVADTTTASHHGELASYILSSPSYSCPLCKRPFNASMFPFPPEYFRNLALQLSPQLTPVKGPADKSKKKKGTKKGQKIRRTASLSSTPTTAVEEEKKQERKRGDKKNGKGKQSKIDHHDGSDEDDSVSMDFKLPKRESEAKDRKPKKSNERIEEDDDEIETLDNEQQQIIEKDEDLQEEEELMKREQSNGYYQRFFVETMKLGHGGFGGVHVCRHVVEDVSLGLFAVKKIPIGNDAQYLKNVIKEVQLLEEVRRHPNVIEYNHSWIDYAQVADFGPIVRCLFILMEYATEGSLDEFMKKHGEVLSDTAVWYFFLSAVAGIQHLHSKGILHRDMKPQNLLLTACEGQPPRLMVSDFGTSTLLGSDDTRYRTGATGTMEFMAPELFVTCAEEESLSSSAHQEGSQQQYVFRHTKATDMWAMGMVLHYLAFEMTLPEFQPDGTVIINSTVARPPEMLQLMTSLLSRDPSKRPSADDILRSSPSQNFRQWFQEGWEARAKKGTEAVPTFCSLEGKDQKSSSRPIRNASRKSSSHISSMAQTRPLLLLGDDVSTPAQQKRQGGSPGSPLCNYVALRKSESPPPAPASIEGRKPPSGVIDFVVNGQISVKYVFLAVLVYLIAMWFRK